MENKEDQSSIDSTPLASASTANPEKKGLNKKRLFVGILIAIVLIAAVAVAFVLLGTSKKEKITDDGLSASTRFSSTDELLSQAKGKTTGKVLQTTVSNSLGGKTADGYGTYGVPSYIVDGRSYATLPTKSDGVGYYGTADVASANYDSFVAFFNKNKFKLVSSGKDTAGPLAYNNEVFNYISYATYESSNMLCMIWHVDATSSPIGSHAASIGCANKKDYAEAAKSVDPFYAAYTVKYPKPGKNLVIGFPYIEDGAAGYKHAVLFVQDSNVLDGEQAEGLFYKAPGDDTWRFAINARGVLNCSDYDTDVFRKAFTNLPCYEGTAEKTVSA